MAHRTRIVIADDDRRTRAALRALLSTHTRFEVVGEAVDGRDVLTQVERWQPDVVLLDLHMPLVNGLQATQVIKGRWPEIVIVVLSMDNAQRSAALAAGADAFVSKADGPDQIVTTLQEVCGEDRGGAKGGKTYPAT
jgi:DNA-binding NarL/FixJ family response regulator